MKKNIKPQKEDSVEKNERKEDEERTEYKVLARKFYDIMKSTAPGSFVDCLYLQEKFKEKGFDLKGNPHLLWRIWRQAEHDFPNSIDFIPQSCVFWRSRPSGWRYLGQPKFENRRKKKIK